MSRLNRIKKIRYKLRNTDSLELSKEDIEFLCEWAEKAIPKTVEPCEWCDGEDHTIDSRDYTCLEIAGNKLTAWGEGEATGYINYCPNCGRKLTE